MDLEQDGGDVPHFTLQKGAAVRRGEERLPRRPVEVNSPSSSNLPGTPTKCSVCGEEMFMIGSPEVMKDSISFKCQCDDGHQQSFVVRFVQLPVPKDRTSRSKELSNESIKSFRIQIVKGLGK